MKERPILFSGPMVRAILDGRKTQTRRVVKNYPAGLARFPYGTPGDRLWVRETCWIWGRWFKNGKTATGRQKWRFKADTPHTAHFDPNHVQNAVKGTPRERRAYWKRPSIFMPRWACRLLLDVKSVRVERLQDISTADAIAEGFEWEKGGGAGPKAQFAFLWQSLNEKRGFGWLAYPWVWVIEFEKVNE